MESTSRRLTRRYTIVSSVVSAFSHSIPGVDELLIIPIHYRLCSKIAETKNVPTRQLPWRKLRRIIYGGAAVRFLCDIPFTPIPFVGPLVHATTAGALTAYLGRVLEAVPRGK